MLYVFCGDHFAAREHTKSFVAICKKKRKNAEYIHFSPSHPTQSLEELLLGQGLFEKKYIVFCDEILSDKVSEHLLKNINEYMASSHMFIVFEPSLSTTHEKQFIKNKTEVKRFASEQKAEDVRALFSFTDVFLQGKRDAAFVSFHTLIQKGVSSVSLLSILLWQLRILVLVAHAKDANEAGVKPFVYTKTKKALTKFADPFSLFVGAEESIRNGRLQGATDEEIVEYIILSSL